MLPTLTILNKYQKRFLSGHPWVYNNELEISNSSKSIEPGSLVQLSINNQPHALGYFNRHSLIAVRVLTRNPAETIDTRFFMARLENALKRRERFYSEPYYRLVHAEADFLPGLIIDRFDSIFIVQINTYGMEKLKNFITEALTHLFKPKGIYFQNESPLRSLEGLENIPSEWIGAPQTTLEVIENGVHYWIELASSQKTGWFFDHRENRQKIASLAKHKSVLDYFCYSGGFALLAAKQGADRVVAVDRSEAALNNARKSAERQALNNIEFVCSEVFKDMDARIAKKEKFDIVILDPPAFVKVKKDLPAGLKGYEKLITKGLQLLNSSGLLFIASCSYHVHLEDLKQCINKALFKTQQKANIVSTLHAGFDHPVHPSLPESEYLKGLILAICLDQ